MPGSFSHSFQSSVDPADLHGQCSGLWSYDRRWKLCHWLLRRQDPKYAPITYYFGDLTVKKAPLQITAKSYSIQYGVKVPTLGYAAAGLVNGDGIGALTRQPSCMTTLKRNAGGYDTSPAGSYPVTCSGAVSGNYAFSYRPGTITVSLAPTSLTYTGPTTVVRGKTLHASAKLTSPGGPVSGRTVAFHLGSQTCKASTGPKGVAMCNIAPVKAGKGTHQVALTFGGDPKGATYDFTASASKKNVMIT